MSSLYGGQGVTGSTNYGPTGLTSGSTTPRGYKMGQMQQFTPEQMELFRSLFSHVAPGGQLSRLAMGDEEAFKQVEGPALRQFSGQLGGLASRFSGMGGLGGRKSSGFQNTASQAAQEFVQGLQSQRMGLQRQALQDLMGLSESLLSQRPYENYLQPKKKSFLEELLGNVIGGASQGLGGLTRLFF